ncbi:MAG: class II glutamine amidotransferase [Bacteroidaceae bacterium]
MCVIIIKPKGQKLPTKSELKMAYRRNHDGCGFVSESDNFKTLDFEEFWQRLKKVPRGENCIIHFRWATHGSVSIANCHPFYDKTTRTWFMHNGVLPVNPKEDITDSEFVFRTYLAKDLRVHHIYSRDFAKTVGQVIGGSRFAFMQNGNLRVFGKFFEYNGCFYSNLNHLPRFVPYWHAS